MNKFVNAVQKAVTGWLPLFVLYNRLMKIDRCKYANRLVKNHILKRVFSRLSAIPKYAPLQCCYVISHVTKQQTSLGVIC